MVVLTGCRFDGNWLPDTFAVQGPLVLSRLRRWQEILTLLGYAGPCGAKHVKYWAKQGPHSYEWFTFVITICQ